MKASNKCINLIKKYEGLHLTAYKDYGGTLTIGYGHTKNVLDGMQITQEQADILLMADIEKAKSIVNRYDIDYHFSQNEYDALVSFAFNIGSLYGLTLDGSRNKETIAQKILEYNKCYGRTLPGLVKRRQEEHDLFISSEKVKVKVNAEMLFYYNEYIMRFRGECVRVDGVDYAICEYAKTGEITEIPESAFSDMGIIFHGIK